MITAAVALLSLLLAVQIAAIVVPAARAGRPATAPTDPLAKLVKHRYVVTLRGAEGMFAGVMTEQQVVATPEGGTELVLTFEQCSTMATHDGDTTADIAGRVILGMSGIAYLQQVG